MGAYFVDTSAVVKRYVHETGTDWVCELTAVDSGNDIYVSRLCGVEVSAAVARRERGGSIPAADALAILAAFVADLVRRFVVVEFTEALANSAMAVARSHGLRAMDSIQLASALMLQSFRNDPGLAPLAMVTADAELLAAARAVGFDVIDPGHPGP